MRPRSVFLFIDAVHKSSLIIGQPPSEYCLGFYFVRPPSVTTTDPLRVTRHEPNRQKETDRVGFGVGSASHLPAEDDDEGRDDGGQEDEAAEDSKGDDAA